MNKRQFTSAVKAVARGRVFTESELTRRGASRRMKKVLESRRNAIRYMKSIVESKRALTEADASVGVAEVVLAAQDVVDQVQSMIEKMADIQYKQLPALQDSIRRDIGVEVAADFGENTLNAIQELTSNLEQGRETLTNSVAILTGEEQSGMKMGSDSMDDELDVDSDDEFDLGDIGGDLGIGDDEDEGDDDNPRPREPKVGRERDRELGRDKR